MDDTQKAPRRRMNISMDAESFIIMARLRRALGAATYTEVVRRAVRELADRMVALGKMEDGT